MKVYAVFIVEDDFYCPDGILVEVFSTYSAAKLYVIRSKVTYDAEHKIEEWEVTE